MTQNNFKTLYENMKKVERIEWQKQGMSIGGIIWHKRCDEIRKQAHIEWHKIRTIKILTEEEKQKKELEKELNVLEDNVDYYLFHAQIDGDYDEVIESDEIQEAYKRMEEIENILGLNQTYKTHKRKKGTDRTSQIKVGEYTISIDRDHRGNYRGNQVMDVDYRGWHYHVDSSNKSQEEIMKIIENYLVNEIQAEEYECENLFIGNVEHKPMIVKCYRKGESTCVLWISGYNNKLHIEANKYEKYVKSLICKKELIEIFGG